MSDLDLAGSSRPCLRPPVVDRFVREQPRAGRAALSLIVKYRVGGPGDGAIEIGVGKDDGRRFAAELERTRFRFPAAALTMSLPTSVEPVNATLSTSGCSAKAAPAVSPKPVTMLTTPSGMPASAISSPRRSAVSGVCSAGFRTACSPRPGRARASRRPSSAGNSTG